MEALIEARNLKKHFDSPKGKVHAVDDVSFKIMPGRTMGVVGESGCGKSTLGRTMIHLLQSTEGSIYFEGKDVTKVKDKELMRLRENADHFPGSVRLLKPAYDSKIHYPGTADPVETFLRQRLLRGGDRPAHGSGGN